LIFIHDRPAGLNRLRGDSPQSPSQLSHRKVVECYLGTTLNGASHHQTHIGLRPVDKAPVDVRARLTCPD
jgi:hypothetical protein